MKRKILALLLCAVVCVSLASCGSKRESAQSVVENGIKALQNYDVESIQTYWGSEVDESSGDDPQMEEMMKAVFSHLSYSIVSSNEDEAAGTATVTVEFTNIDMDKVVSSFMSEAITIVFQYALLPEEQQPSDEELEGMYMDKFMELLNNENNETVKKTADVELSLVDDEWKIAPSEDVIDAMLGGMISSFNAVNESFS